MRASVDGRIFAKHIVISNLQIGRLPLVFQILRFSTDRGEWEKLVAAAEFRGSAEDHMRVEDAIVAELDVVADDTVGPHLDVESERGER